MKSMIIFPIFIMFLFTIFSVSGGAYYNSTIANYTLSNSTQGYGLGYSILPNGTYVFNSTIPVYVYIHEGDGDPLYTFLWSDINHIVEDYPWTVLLYVQNGTSYYMIGTLEWNNYKNQSAITPFYSYLASIATTGEDMVNPSGSQLFDLSSTQISLSILVAAIAIGTAIGIRVLGSGMSETSQEIIFKGTFFSAMWVIMSIIAQPLITEVTFFGSVFYIGISLMFLIGFVMSIRGGGADA